MKLHVITPVKNSMDTTVQAEEHIMRSTPDMPFSYFIYNDFSDEASTSTLTGLSSKHGFQLINLEEITTHPSPNYLLILQTAQKKALAENAHLVIVESDVMVQPNTFATLGKLASELKNPGMIAAVTTDEQGVVNFPYLYAGKFKKGIVPTKKRLSFCCTLLTNELLNRLDFGQLNPEKNWYDVFISHESLKSGFINYLLTDHPVVHKPHSSRPWKKLKYSNPLLYYWRKFTEKRDKI
jgi:hypothetical protein